MTFDSSLGVCGAAIVLALWILIDFKGWLRFVQEHHRLNHEGRWEELEALFRKELRRLRPWVRLVLSFRFPGGLEVLYSTFLFQRGQTEEALRYARTAARKSRGHAVHRDALTAEALALAELGQYDDARRVTAEARAAGGSTGADYVESLACLYQGRFDEAIGLARRACEDPKGDLGRVVVSSALLSKGEFQPALEVLLDRVQDVKVYYTAESLRSLERTSEGRSVVEAHRKQWAGVAEPLRFIHAAYVYLEMGDLEGLRFSLEKADASRGGHPMLQVIHRHLSAFRCAAAGDSDGTDRQLQEAREMLQRHPRRSVEVELRRVAGRAHLALGRVADAVAELEGSLKGARHPLEKHVAQFWLARALEAAGEKGRAAELYRAVASDGIPSRWRAEAAKAPPSGPTPVS